MGAYQMRNIIFVLYLFNIPCLYTDGEKINMHTRTQSHTVTSYPCESSLRRDAFT